MSKVIRVRYEGGVLRPLESVDLREGEELRITMILPKGFPEFIREVKAEAREDIDKVLREARERWKQ